MNRCFLFLLILLGPAVASAQPIQLGPIDVPVGDSEFVAVLRYPDFSPSMNCKILGYDQDGPYTSHVVVHADSVFFRPTKLGPLEDVVRAVTRVEDKFQSPCVTRGNEYRISGIGVPDTLLTIRPRKLVSGCVADFVELAYIDTFELEVQNKRGVSASIKGWKLESLPDSVYSINVTEIGATVDTLTLAANGGLARLRFVVRVYLGPYWSNQTISTKLISQVSTESDSTYSTPIDLVLPGLPKSGLVSSKPHEFEWQGAEGAAKDTSFRVYVNPYIDTAWMYYPYPMSGSTTRDGDTLRSLAKVGPAARGRYREAIQVRWLMKTFERTTRVDSILLPTDIRVTRYATLSQDTIRWKGLIDTLPTRFSVAITRGPGLFNYRYATEREIQPLSFDVNDSVRLEFTTRIRHMGRYKPRIAFLYDIPTEGGFARTDSIVCITDFDVSADEWVETGWPNDRKVTRLAAGPGDSIWVASDSDVYLSNDAGINWKFIAKTRAAIQELVASPRGAVCLFLADYPHSICHLVYDSIVNLTSDIKQLLGNFSPYFFHPYGDHFYLEGASHSKLVHVQLEATSLTHKFSELKKPEPCYDQLKFATEKDSTTYQWIFSMGTDECVPRAPAGDLPSVAYLGGFYCANPSGPLWKRTLNGWDATASNVKSMNRRHDRFSVISGDRTVLAFTGYSNYHTATRGLEKEKLMQIAQGDTIIYVSTSDNRILRTSNPHDPLVSVAANSATPSLSSLSVYPNPTTGAARVEIDLAHSGFATLSLYNLEGRELARLKNEQLVAGVHQAILPDLKLANGVYQLRLRTPEHEESINFVVAK
jgi:hypothetical protein